MHAGFLQAVAEAYSKAGAPTPEMSKYRNFSTAEDFHSAHWSGPGFAAPKPTGAENASKWVANLWDSKTKQGSLHELRETLQRQGGVFASVPHEKTDRMH